VQEPVWSGPILFNCTGQPTPIDAETAAHWAEDLDDVPIESDAITSTMRLGLSKWGESPSEIKRRRVVGDSVTVREEAEQQAPIPRREDVVPGSNTRTATA